jgi:CheY-like chemotaxis protein
MPGSSKEEKKVMIVEDEHIVASTLKTIVEKLGFGVLGIAHSGEEALRLLEESNPHPELVLMDITLKGPLDGIETARIIQERSDALILYVTGNKDQEVVQRAVEETMPFALVNKPFNVDSLRSLITDVLDPDSPSHDTPRVKDVRVSERLPIPANDQVTIHIKDRGHESKATLKNLSMSGAGVLTKELIMGMDRIKVTITPQAGWEEISSVAYVRHMTMASKQYFYGIEFELDREAQKALAAYYSYLIQKWYTSD